MKFIYNKLEAQAAEDYIDANNFYLVRPYSIKKALYQAFERVKQCPDTNTISSAGVTFLFDKGADENVYVTILVNPSFEEEDEFVEVEVV